MNLIKYEGNIKNFFGLVEEKNKCYLFYMPVEKIIAESSNDDIEIEFRNNKTRFTKNIEFKIEFIANHINNSFCHLFEINNENEYDTIVKILKEIL